VEPGDSGSDARGIGSFVDGGDADGRGIRTFPYSTDMTICPLTYDDIKTADQYGRGEFLVAILWDMYWMFTDIYGWDGDWTNADAGNVRSVRLAFDAMKAVPCDPDFIDIREAIFAIDGGAHECELWEMFARRGLGFYTDRGDLNNGDDGIEDFEPKPTCIPTLKIKKDMPSLVVPGAQMVITFDIANHTTQTVNNVIVTDLLDEGMTVAEGPAGITYTQSGNEVIFDIGDMVSLDERRFSYTVNTDQNKVSETLLLNGVESTEQQNEWERELGPDNQTDQNSWTLSAIDANTGNRSWFSYEVDQDTDHRLIMEDLPIAGAARPVVRFWHRINVTQTVNGGWVELSPDNSNLWYDAKDDFLRNGYTSALSYGLGAIPGLQGYSGLTSMGDFVDTYVDLTDYQGQDLDIRFRFATQDEGDDGDVTNYPQSNGWYIDDFELMDMKSYYTVATIAGDNAAMIETDTIETFINSDFFLDTEDLADEVNIILFPNPVNNTLNLNMYSDKKRAAQIQLTSLDGKLLQERNVELLKNENLFKIDVSSYQAGMYLVQIMSENRITTKKIVIE